MTSGEYLAATELHTLRATGLNAGLRRWQAERRKENARREKREAIDAKREAAYLLRTARQRQHAKDEWEAAQRTARSAKRRAAQLQRTPAWADMAAIGEFYAAARRMTDAMGVPYHVDHVIPLQGRLVSGLHVHNNLQILPGSENSKKNNRFEIEP